MTLLKKTKEIVLNSIKSVIFIDEKALENYKTKSNEFVYEQQLSINLTNNFKNKGINLSVHKFKPSDLLDQSKLNYFFKRRDLILLDWKLEGNNGDEFSLKLLSKVVEQKHIHFCSIYTSEGNFDEIINNICTYFSGYNKEYYESIIEIIEPYRTDNPEIFESISFDNINSNSIKFNIFMEIENNLPNLIKEITGINNFGKALIQIKYAFSNFHKSEIINPVPTHINRNNNSLNINNTIITIIPKTEDSATKILNKLNHQIYKSDNCFIQLLGLDMQNSFSENSSFIDENLLNTDINTLMFHRKQLIDNNSNIEFENFIKSLLLKHSKQTLENSHLNILESVFLDTLTKKRYRIAAKDISTLNTFYNGTYLNKKNKLNFGDIFKKENSNEYYMCITALCDCLHPENIKNNFFFVKGIPAPNLDEVIKTGDKGFKSYINSETCILWTSGDYVKPFQIHISNTTFNENIIYSKIILNSEIVELELKYIFSLKSSYAQRVANHSFAHPIRVGVDFVKI